MRQTTHCSFEKALALCHAETAVETVGTRDTELGDTKCSSETYHEQTHGRFGHELDSHDGMVLWFLLMDERWRCPGGMIFLRPPFSLLLLLFVDPQSGPGAHLCPDEVLTQSRPTPQRPLSTCPRQPLWMLQTASGLWLHCRCPQRACDSPVGPSETLQPEQKATSPLPAPLIWEPSGSPPSPRHSSFHFQRHSPQTPASTSLKPLWLLT